MSPAQPKRPPAPPIVHVDEKRIPALPHQRFYWNVNTLAPDPQQEWQELVWRIRGALDVGALETAIERLNRRQSAFKARFELVDDRLYMVLDDALGISLQRVDLRKDSASAGQFIAKAREQKMDLLRGPLSRALLVQLRDDEWLFYFAAHHIVFDGVSYALFSEELWELYRAELEGRPPKLPALEVGFADYLHWQLALSKSEAGAALDAFWKTQLAGAVGVSLPTDRPRDAVEARLKQQSLNGVPAGHLPVRFPEAFTEAVKVVSTKARVTRYVAMMGAFLELIRRLSGQQDFLIITGYANRHHEKLANVIGLFVQPLPLRFSTASEAPLGRTLTELQRHVFTLRAAADRPAMSGMGKHDPALTRINFNYLPSDTFLWTSQTPQAPGIYISLEPDMAWSLTMHDLAFFLNDLGGDIIYSTALFDRSTVERWLAAFYGLAAGMAEHPDSRLREVRAGP